MNDISTSKKVNDKFETMISLKTKTFDDGKTQVQLSFSPLMQKELYAWIKSQDGSYFNMNVKEWNDKKDEGYPTNSHPDKGSNSYGDSQDIPF